MLGGHENDWSKPENNFDNAYERLRSVPSISIVTQGMYSDIIIRARLRFLNFEARPGFSTGRAPKFQKSA
jgi:hypothetical protein